jgi:hypothetical protein
LILILSYKYPRSLGEQAVQICTLPLNDDPELFGLHLSIDIRCPLMGTYSCLTTLLALQPQVVGQAAQSQEDENVTVVRKY